MTVSSSGHAWYDDEFLEGKGCKRGWGRSECCHSGVNRRLGGGESLPTGATRWIGAPLHPFQQDHIGSPP